MCSHVHMSARFSAHLCDPLTAKTLYVVVFGHLKKSRSSWFSDSGKMCLKRSFAQKPECDLAKLYKRLSKRPQIFCMLTLTRKGNHFLASEISGSLNMFRLFTNMIICTGTFLFSFYILSSKCGH